jgi:cell division protein FtsQ
MNSTKGATSRADEVRRRRASQPRKSTRAGVGKRAQKSSAPARPAVLVRGSLASSMVQERRGKKKPKRRYDVALSTPGAEMRLPSMPRLQVGWRLVSGMLVIGLAYLLYSVWNAPEFRVLAAEVNGAKRLTSQDINSVAGVAGKPVFTVEPEKVMQELSAAFPELSTVLVEVELPAKVTVMVEERQPVLAWVQDDQEMWIDSSGIAFQPRGESGSLVVVEARTSLPGLNEETTEEDTSEAVTPASFVPPELLRAIFIMAEEAPEGTPLVYDRDHGLGWKDKRGWDVYFGTNDEDMDMKLRVYKQIVRRLKKDEVRPKFISVEYVHAPYYRLDR